MTHSIHNHQWVYLGDLALVVSSKEQNVQLRRLEYCVGCSELRVSFPSGWYAMKGMATEAFLSKFDGDAEGMVFKIPPKEFKPRSPKPAPRRLGKGLRDLTDRPPLTSIFKK